MRVDAELRSHTLQVLLSVVERQSVAYRLKITDFSIYIAPKLVTCQVDYAPWIKQTPENGRRAVPKIIPAHLQSMR